MNPMYLKKFRQKTGLKQKEFALSVGLSQQAISHYETGRRELTLEAFRDIKAAFGFVSSSDSSRLSIMIDYLRITFKSVRDLEWFTENVLFIKFKEFTSVTAHIMNYNRIWKRGDIWIFDFMDKHDTGQYQITLQLSGKGCRQMELIMEQQGITWFDLIENMVAIYPDMNTTRIDLAIDECYLGPGREEEQFFLPDLITKYYKKELVSEALRTWNYIGGGAIDFDTHEDLLELRQGLSLYFGSRQSNLYFNFYEKRYEYAKQERISVEEALEVFGVWNRYELRFSDTKANGVVEEFLNGVDLGEIARGIVNSKLHVYDGMNAYGALLADQKWQRLFGGVEPLKFKTAPEPYSIDRTIRWLMYQVSNKLVMVDEYDKIMNEQYMQMIYESGRITDEDRQRLDWIKASIGKKDD